jgi:hypothetical protein
MTPTPAEEQHTAEHKAASLHSLGWEEGAGATIWARAVSDELASHEKARERFDGRNLEAWERLHSTALMLVVAINQVLTFEERVRRITGDAELARARDRFNRVGPNAEAIRDIATHLDEYAVGEGERQIGRARKPLPPVTETYVTPFIYWTDSGSTIIKLADEDLNLRAAADAVLTLADTVERVRVKYLKRAGEEADAALRRRWGLDENQPGTH